MAKSDGLVTLHLAKTEASHLIQIAKLKSEFNDQASSVNELKLKNTQGSLKLGNMEAEITNERKRVRVLEQERVEEQLLREKKESEIKNWLWCYHYRHFLTHFGLNNREK